MRHQNSVFHGVLKHVPWARLDRLVQEHEAGRVPRSLQARAHLVATLYAQLSGSRSLRDIETSLKSQAAKLYHLGGAPVSKSALATANSTRPCETFAGLLAALMAQLQRRYRRKIGDCVRLIDSTSVRLSALSGEWATFSAGVCGAKAHVVYDPDADQPLYLMVTAANVNDIVAAKQMPIEPGATYVFDLGYYDYGWWASLHEAACRIVTRLKANTPFTIVEERPVEVGSAVLSDRLGHLPKRLAASRKQSDGGSRARGPSEDRDRQGLAHLHQRLGGERRGNRLPLQASLGDRAVLQVGQADPQDRPLPRNLRERGAHPDRRRAHRLRIAAPGSRSQWRCRKPAHLRPADQDQYHGAPPHRRAAAKALSAPDSNRAKPISSSTPARPDKRTSAEPSGLASSWSRRHEKHRPCRTAVGWTRPPTRFGPLERPRQVSCHSPKTFAFAGSRCGTTSMRWLVPDLIRLKGRGA